MDRIGHVGLEETEIAVIPTPYIPSWSLSGKGGELLD